MIPGRVFGRGGPKTRSSLQHKTTPYVETAPRPMEPTGFDITAASIKRAKSRAVPLRSSGWNVYAEVTDECGMGLALFEVYGGDHAILDTHVPVKSMLLPRRLQVFPLSNTWGGTVYALASSGNIAMLASPSPSCSVSGRPGLNASSRSTR